MDKLELPAVVGSVQDYADSISAIYTWITNNSISITEHSSAPKEKQLEFVDAAFYFVIVARELILEETKDITLTPLLTHLREGINRRLNELDNSCDKQ